MTRLKVPFYPNLKDDLHCFQAALRMVLATSTPPTRYSYAALDRITGYRRGTTTWDTKALLWLSHKGFYVKKISIFDYHAFAKLGTRYLKDFWRSDVYEFQESLSDFSGEQRQIKRLLKEKNIESITKRPTLAVLEKHLSSGWLAIIHLDVSRFDRTKNYSPHSIVITAITATAVFFHDPGFPPEIHRRVGRKRFARVLSDGELILIKKAQ